MFSISLTRTLAGGLFEDQRLSIDFLKNCFAESTANSSQRPLVSVGVKISQNERNVEGQVDFVHPSLNG